MLPLIFEKTKEAFDRQEFGRVLAMLEEGKRLVGPDPRLLVQESQCLYYLRRAPEAVAILRKLVAEHPNEPEYKAHLALYLRAVGNFDESEELVRVVPPDLPGAAFLGGWHLLRKGAFLEGMRMREKESGIYRSDALYHLPAYKKYIPGMPLAGKRVLLALEGGNGDEIAYVRFAQHLARAGAQVLLGGSPELLSILSRVPGISSIGDISTARPEMYDIYIPAMSMISLFELSDPSFGISFPYLSPDPRERMVLAAEVQGVAAGRKKIGIQWRGNPRFDYSEFKTFPADLLAPFSRLGQLFSFQLIDQAGDNLLPVSAGAYDLNRATRPSWERTLAAIDEMDIVIAGDTTITHMAGALAKPTLLMLPHAPHPYWADLKEQSTWYPSIQVFRQPEYNDWEGAFRRAYMWLEEALKK